jgi:hypothetical protein
MVRLKLTFPIALFRGRQNLLTASIRKHYSTRFHTLTLNVNGQNITISSPGGNLVINSQNQTVVINPNSAPVLSVSFLRSQPTKFRGLTGNSSLEYDFNVTVTVPPNMNCPFGVNANSTEESRALLPLVDRYNLVTNNYIFNGTLPSADWVDRPIVNGMNTFSLFSHKQFNANQIDAMTNDLFNAFTLAMKSNT